MTSVGQLSHFRILAADCGMGGASVYCIAEHGITVTYIAEESVKNEFDDGDSGDLVSHAKIGADKALTVEMLKGTSAEDLDRAIGVLMDELEFHPPTGETLLDIYVRP
ncbi:hypothetical protein A5780_19330 [Nocardia sp. 852002-20019_SCH5090214]|uniref:hypothetical protein n=1 Tax=Nocardia sp. 852002-20019_SCH5090214 TaxID=1834087 RepID=UPI0007FE5D92|nr:hypothetical protein [Nocardia sp. 852002-20019_SCH5090214]OBA62212.1 hypothetical protein A5780_19330 [Nocardia sp. 852002-20019_SCH5090214]